MKSKWDLGSFSLDLTDLWIRSDGPSFNSEHTAMLEKANRAMRGLFDSGAVGFYDWPTRITKAELGAMRETCDRLRREFDSAVVLGIGGSYLGGATLFQALREPDAEEQFPIAWVSNVDPAAIRRADHFLKNRHAAAVVISKSGATTETLSAFFHLSARLDQKGYVIITDPKAGELRRLAERYSWTSFPVPTNVGGRYSVLTSVGLFPAFLGGLPVEDILRGAREMRETLEQAPLLENPAFLFAFAMHAWDVGQGHSVQYLMPYASNLRLLADWYVQLWGESIGKKQRSGPQAPVGFTPVGALGTSDQHSLLQLFKEGPSNKLIGFIDVLDREKNTRIGEPSFEVESLRFLFPHSFENITHFACEATQKSLQNTGVPTYRIEVPRLDGRALGALFFFFETACAFAGELYDVDAFNQPGVEEAKRLLRAAL